MAFLVYRKDGPRLVKTGGTYALAGHNLIYRLWHLRGRPTDQGWQASADDLIREYSDGNETYESLRFLIDYFPSSPTRIAMIELLDIWIYTFSGGTPGEAEWSPMMLRLRDVRDEDLKRQISPEEKERIISVLRDPDALDNGEKPPDFVEFLYLREGWNWGRIGGANAAFIGGPARDYSRRYF